jgi:hypothetical protein
MTRARDYRPGRVWTRVGVLATGHMVVDALSIYTTMRVAGAVFDGSDSIWVIALYVLMAFAAQAPFGWVLDRLNRPVVAASVGMGLASVAAALWSQQPIAMLWLAGLGNALFHVGGGKLTLHMAEGRAAHGGVFVGPGDLGVVLGTFIGMGWWPGAEALILSGAVMTGVTALIRRHFSPLIEVAPGSEGGMISAAICSRGREGGDDRTRAVHSSSALQQAAETLQQPGGAVEQTAASPQPFTPEEEREKASRKGRFMDARAAVWLGLLMLAVACRQVVGGAVGGAWMSERSVWIVLMVAAMVGKMLSGFAADRWGWMLVAAPLTAAAVPLLAIPGNAGVGLCATLLVQAAMPVTLAALARLLPRYPGLAFGLASLSLSFGELPALLRWTPWPALAVAAVQMVSAAAIVVALRGIHKRTGLGHAVVRTVLRA